MLDSSKIGEDTLDIIMNDARTHVETLSTSLKGINIARSTGCISAVSSILVILIIARSSQRFSTVYHRLMFGISVYDLIASIAMALTTLPMPADMIYRQFEGSHLGTNESCEAQASSLLVASMGTFAYTIAICSYYMTTARKMLHEEDTDVYTRTSRWFEPTIHFACITVPVVTTFTHFLSGDESMAPTPFSPFCTLTHYPYWCMRSSEPTCSQIQAQPSHVRFLGSFYAIYFATGVLYIVVSLFISARSIWRLQVKQQNRIPPIPERNKYCATQHEVFYPRDPATTCTTARSSSQQSSRPVCCSPKSKIIHFQTLTYITSALIVPICIVAKFTGGESSTIFQAYFLITRPLQGFFNFLIFMSEKIYRHRLANRRIGCLKAFYNILTKPIQDFYVFSHLDIVQKTSVGEGQIGEMTSDKSQASYSSKLCRPSFPITDPSEISLNCNSQPPSPSNYIHENPFLSETLLNATQEILETASSPITDSDEKDENHITNTTFLSERLLNKHATQENLDVASKESYEYDGGIINACNHADTEAQDEEEGGEEDENHITNSTFLSETLLNEHATQENMDSASEESYEYDDGIINAHNHADTEAQDEEEGGDSCIPLSYYQGLNKRDIIKYIEDSDSDVVQDYGDEKGEINEFGLTTIYESGELPDGSDHDSEW